jgi:hypothetical protein
MYGYRLGDCCHWCGQVILFKRRPKSGKHVFCCDGHKMAHARAFAKWCKRCVTARSGSPACLASSSISQSNAQPIQPTRSSSREIPKRQVEKSNAKKRG